MFWTICLWRNVVAFCHKQDSPMRVVVAFFFIVSLLVKLVKSLLFFILSSATIHGEKDVIYSTVEMLITGDDPAKPDIRRKSPFIHTPPAFDAPVNFNRQRHTTMRRRCCP